MAIAVVAVQPSSIGSLPSGISTPVVAFELARSTAEVERMFGAPGSLDRANWRAGMQHGVSLDAGLLLAYGLLLAGVALRQGTGRVRWLGTGLAVSAALLDALENRELLLILERLGGDYAAALARLAWFTWAKWLALGLYFAVLAPALWRGGKLMRVAAISGVAGALAAAIAFFVRGVAAEIMAGGIAFAIAALVLSSLLHKINTAPIEPRRGTLLDSRDSAF